MARENTISLKEFRAQLLNTERDIKTMEHTLSHLMTAMYVQGSSSQVFPNQGGSSSHPQSHANVPSATVGTITPGPYYPSTVLPVQPASYNAPPPPYNVSPPPPPSFPYTASAPGYGFGYIGSNTSSDLNHRILCLLHIILFNQGLTMVVPKEIMVVTNITKAEVIMEATSKEDGLVTLILVLLCNLSVRFVSEGVTRLLTVFTEILHLLLISLNVRFVGNVDTVR